MEHFSIGSRKAKEGPRRQKGSKDPSRKSRIKRLHWDYLQASIFMCDFLARFGMHGYACVFLVLLLSLSDGFKVE